MFPPLNDQREKEQFNAESVRQRPTAVLLVLIVWARQQKNAYSERAWKPCRDTILEQPSPYVGYCHGFCVVFTAKHNF